MTEFLREKALIFDVLRSQILEQNFQRAKACFLLIFNQYEKKNYGGYDKNTCIGLIFCINKSHKQVGCHFVWISFELQNSKHYLLVRISV